MEGVDAGGLDWSEGGYGGVSIHLVLLTCGASFSIFLDIEGQARPPELSGNKLAGLKEAGITSSFVVMVAEQDGAVEIVIIRYIDTALVG